MILINVNSKIKKLIECVGERMNAYVAEDMRAYDNINKE
jgi:hypothetical protein